MRRIILGNLKRNSKKIKQIRKAYRVARKKILREFDISKFDYDIIFVNWRESGENGFWWYIDFDYVRVNVGVDKILSQSGLMEGVCEGFAYNFVADSINFESKFLRNLLQNAYAADFLGWKYDEKYSLENLSKENLLKIHDALSGNIDEDWLWSENNGWHFYGFSKKYFESLKISRKDILKIKESDLRAELLTKIDKKLKKM